MEYSFEDDEEGEPTFRDGFQNALYKLASRDKPERVWRWQFHVGHIFALLIAVIILYYIVGVIRGSEVFLPMFFYTKTF